MDLLTRKCPIKQIKRINERIRKAIPKDTPKAVVLIKKYMYCVKHKTYSETCGLIILILRGTHTLEGRESAQ